MQEDGAELDAASLRRRLARVAARAAGIQALTLRTSSAPGLTSGKPVFRMLHATMGGKDAPIRLRACRCGDRLVRNDGRGAGRRLCRRELRLRGSGCDRAAVPSRGSELSRQPGARPRRARPLSRPIGGRGALLLSLCRLRLQRLSLWRIRTGRLSAWLLQPLYRLSLRRSAPLHPLSSGRGTALETLPPCVLQALVTTKRRWRCLYGRVWNPPNDDG